MNQQREMMDALFVIHQDADLKKIGHIIHKKGYRQVYVLTTHHPLGKEREIVLSLAPRVHTQPFADLLTDGVMAHCDQKATNELLSRLSDRRIQRTYMGHFINRSLWHKNAAVWKKLKEFSRFQSIYYSPELGVHSRFWAELGGTRLETPLAGFRRRALFVYGRKIRNILKKRSIHTICRNGKCYVFVSPVGRLKFFHDAEPLATPISRIDWILFAFSGIRGKRLLTGKIKKITPQGHQPVLSTTIHAHLHELSETEFPLHIFVDGYHPSNYPRSYVDMYADCRFVVRDMFGEAWFRKHGKKTLKPPPFIAPALMNPITNSIRSVKQVLLALNHAGDWTALINRSDTDLLLDAFSQLARTFPSLHFTVRPHPTMATWEHEGLNSLNRIKTFIREIAILNLTVSQNPLSTDLEKADLVISEYSQVLIDALQMGKLGLSVNLTGRRSFMYDYETFGFPVVNSKKELTAWVEDLTRNTIPAFRRQNQAVQKYNQSLLLAGYS